MPGGSSIRAIPATGRRPIQRLDQVLQRPGDRSGARPPAAPGRAHCCNRLVASDSSETPRGRRGRYRRCQCWIHRELARLGVAARVPAGVGVAAFPPEQRVGETPFDLIASRRVRPAHHFGCIGELGAADTQKGRQTIQHLVGEAAVDLRRPRPLAASAPPGPGSRNDRAHDSAPAHRSASGPRRGIAPIERRSSHHRHDQSRSADRVVAGNVLIHRRSRVVEISVQCDPDSISRALGSRVAENGHGRPWDSFDFDGGEGRCSWGQRWRRSPDPPRATREAHGTTPGGASYVIAAPTT